MANVLLTSEKYIKELTNISDNVQGGYIGVSLREAQEIDLQSVIGHALLEKLKDLVNDGSIKNEENADYKNLLDLYIQPYLSYATITKLIMIAAIKIDNIGVNMAADEKIQNLSLDDTFRIQDYYEKKTDFYKKRLQEYLKGDADLYPEINGNGKHEMKAVLYSAASTSLFLGGNRGRKVHKGCNGTSYSGSTPHGGGMTPQEVQAMIDAALEIYWDSGVTEEHIESAVTEVKEWAEYTYTPTENFATINGSEITNGGNIEITGKTKYVLNETTIDVRMEIFDVLYNEPSYFQESEFYYLFEDNKYIRLTSVKIEENQLLFLGINISNFDYTEQFFVRVYPDGNFLWTKERILNDSNFATINGSKITNGGNVVIESGISAEDAQEIVDSALTDYTPTTGFATINGSAITEGGDIVISGGGSDMKIYYLNSMTNNERDALRRELYLLMRSPSDLIKYIFYIQEPNKDEYNEPIRVYISRFENDHSVDSVRICFSGIFSSRNSRKFWTINNLKINNNGALTNYSFEEYAPNTYTAGSHIDITNNAISTTGVVASTDITNIVKLTQAEYDVITPDPNTFYIITQ